MKKSISMKILESHLIEGKIEKGQEIGIRIDQTLTQDTTGTMAYLAFEALDIDHVKTELSVSYVDHNTIQTDFRNADDHIYLQTVAKKHGIKFSKPGNGICHSIHYQRFAKPGKTLLGSDSHTPTSGAVGSLSIGAGGMDVAMAMAGQVFYLKTPIITNVRLEGTLKPGVSSKDIILELLRRLSVKGGLGRIFEYSGSGVQTLSVPERATICNMGAELGATTSIFASDEVVKAFLTAQKRPEDWQDLMADEDAVYDEEIIIDLNTLEPLIAIPHMPDRVKEVKSLDKTKVNQVFIGSCTNASYKDIAKAAQILEGKTVHPDVSLSVAAGSIQVMEMLLRDGIIQKLVAAGARILESACGPCVGVGQAPSSRGVSVRTSNRNFIGRSGTADALVYLASPEVAAASALTGYISDPRDICDLEALSKIEESEAYIINDRMILDDFDGKTEVLRGPNIKPMPVRSELDKTITAGVSIVVDDNISTDDIMPAGSKILSLRSNVPAISEYVFNGVDPEFAKRAQMMKSSIIVAGENYGQGSSREHAALAPMYLGVKAVLAKSLSRIHGANLINYGIVPLKFLKTNDFDNIDEMDELSFELNDQAISEGKLLVTNLTKHTEFEVEIELTDRQADILKAGGLLNYVKKKDN